MVLVPLSSILLLSLAQADAGLAAEARLRLIFGGDVIPHEPIKRVAASRARQGEGGNNDGWDHVLGGLAPALQSADVAVVNLETPIVTLKKPETGTMVFHAPPVLLRALKRAGVDVATFANNHCLDQHREGIVSTRAFLADAGLLSAGADVDERSAWRALTIEQHGVRVGLLPVARFLNGFNNTKDAGAPHVPVVAYDAEPIIGSHSIAQLLATISTEAARVDALIVIMHWGVEYRFEPAQEDRALAKSMLEAGAFAVIGHHPHVLQPVELMPFDGGVGLVAFSLGNLLSNQDFDDVNGAKRDGLLVELELRKAPDAGVTLGALTGIPVETTNTLGSGSKRNIQTVLLDDELAAIEGRLAELVDLADPKTKAERKQLLARRAVAVERRARIGRMLPLSVGTLERAR